MLLLLALRAPLAAAAVTLVGAATVLAAYGLMALLALVIETDPIAVALASMTGLALGVGYSLLILDRFHQQEQLPDADPRDVALAASTAVATTGRAVLFAGSGLILALLLATAIAAHEDPRLAGDRRAALLDARAWRRRRRHARRARPVRTPPDSCPWRRAGGDHARLGPPRRCGGLDQAPRRDRRRARHGGAARARDPRLSLRTGPPGVSQLPAGDPARRSFETVARVMGPGWPTPTT